MQDGRCGSACLFCSCFLQWNLEKRVAADDDRELGVPVITNHLEPKREDL